MSKSNTEINNFNITLECNNILLLSYIESPILVSVDTVLLDELEAVLQQPIEVFTEESGAARLLSDINNILNSKLDKVDNNLITKNKTVVGAINTLKLEIDNNTQDITALDTSLDNHISDYNELNNLLLQHYREYNDLGKLVLLIEEDVTLLKQKSIYKVVEELPQEGQVNIIYLVPRQNALDKNIKDEYMWIDGKWESVGTTSIDLADYTTKVEFNEVKQENVDLRKRLEEIELILPAAL